MIAEKGRSTKGHRFKLWMEKSINMFSSTMDLYCMHGPEASTTPHTVTNDTQKEKQGAQLKFPGY